MAPKSPPPHARPRREADCPIDLPGYEGVVVRLWMNPPMSHQEEHMRADESLGFRKAVRALILAHTFADTNGKPIVLDESASQLTSEEFYAVLAAWNAKLSEIAATPKASGGPSATTS